MRHSLRVVMTGTVNAVEKRQRARPEENVPSGLQTLKDQCLRPPAHSTLSLHYPLPILLGANCESDFISVWECWVNLTSNKNPGRFERLL